MSERYDCTGCGACCTNPEENRAEGYAYYVEVDRGCTLLKKADLMKRFTVLDPEGTPHLRLDPSQRCAALVGKLGQRVNCSIYAHRPRGCRLVEAGSPRCLQARQERGIA